MKVDGSNRGGGRYGHGLSEDLPPCNPARVADFFYENKLLEQVNDLLSHLHLNTEPHNVIGFSMGAYLASKQASHLSDPMDQLSTRCKIRR